MGSENTVKLRITVWRPYRPAQALAYVLESQDTTQYLGQDTILHHDVFSWQTREDVWGGLINEEQRRLFPQRFMSEFDPFIPPEQRSLSKLGALLSDLRSVAESDDAEWTGSAQSEEEQDSLAPIRVNPLLAFYCQLMWIYSVFKDAPDASVTVR